MADTFGATSLPVANVARDVDGIPTEPIADPGLATVLSWVSAVLQFECGAAWLNLEPNEPLVRKQYTHDPREEDFSSDKLPALFAYRGDATPRWFEDGNLGEECPITILWAYHPSKHDRRIHQRGIGRGISRALNKAINFLNARHPAWIVVGDTDPFAATYGSSLLTYAGLHSITMGPVREAEIQLDLGGRKASYPGITVELACREDYAPDVVFEGSTQTIIRRDEATPTASDPFDQTILTP